MQCHDWHTRTVQLCTLAADFYKLRREDAQYSSHDIPWDWNNRSLTSKHMLTHMLRGGNAKLDHDSACECTCAFLPQIRDAAVTKIPRRTAVCIHVFIINTRYGPDKDSAQDRCMYIYHKYAMRTWQRLHTRTQKCIFIIKTQYRCDKDTTKECCVRIDNEYAI